LKRLHVVRKAQERQCRTLMEMALADQYRLQEKLKAVHKRRVWARTLLAASVMSGEVDDRLACLEEIGACERLSAVVKKKVEAAEQQVLKLRQEYLAKRIERRQVESLLETAQIKETAEANRKEQKLLDEWHRSGHGRNNQRADQIKRADQSTPGEQHSESNGGFSQT
jgi:flagellar export protein FliJ